MDTGDSFLCQAADSRARVWSPSLEKMKHIKPGFIACIVLLVACLFPLNAQAAGPKISWPVSGIFGHVEGRGVWVVRVTSGGATTVANVSTDRSSNFEVNLPPGTYVLTPLYYPPVHPGQPTPDYVLVGPPTSVKVAKNHFTFVALPTSQPLPPRG